MSEGGTSAADCCRTEQGPSCLAATRDFLHQRGEFSEFVLIVVVVLVVIMVVIALAQRALGLRTMAVSFYRPGDTLLFGVVLSVLTAVVVLPAYAALQSTGGGLTEQVLKSMAVPWGADWFSTGEAIGAQLAPPLSPGVLLTGVLTIATPLLTGVATSLFTHAPRGHR